MKITFLPISNLAGFQLSFKKEIIKSLPTKDENCVLIDYPTCVLDVINLGTMKAHNCSLAFLFNYKYPFCSDNLTLAKIKEIKMAFSKSKYKNCRDLKPCNVVNFHLSNAENAQYQDVDSDPFGFVKVDIYFENYIVKEITDSYDYNSISIISEIGGSLGILVGMSVMTMVECLANFLLKMYES